tara:strand:+ start:271 stop:447 length:177 start_codon:yes stop_codon:yes gene_type:complete
MRNAPYHERINLLKEKRAFIGRGHGCSGLTLLIKDGANLNEFLSGEPTINKKKTTNKM